MESVVDPRQARSQDAIVPTPYSMQFVLTLAFRCLAMLEIGVLLDDKYGHLLYSMLHLCARETQWYAVIRLLQLPPFLTRNEKKKGLFVRSFVWPILSYLNPSNHVVFLLPSVFSLM